MKKIFMMLTALLVMGLNSVRAAEQDLLVSTNNTTLQLFAVKGEPLKMLTMALVLTSSKPATYGWRATP